MAKNKTLILIASIIVIAAFIGLWQFFGSEAPPPERPVAKPVPAPAPQRLPKAEPTPEPAPAPIAMPVAEPEEPVKAIVNAPATLENSDPQVMLAIADFAPKLSTWLLPSEQIRKWVLTVDLMADGKLPKRYRPVDFPMAKFLVEKQGTEMLAASNNTQRMNSIIDTVTSIEPSLLVRYYQEWSPTLEKAYKEQGKPDTFDQRLRQTISQVLAVNELEEPASLKRPSVMYQYTDEELEKATDIEKLLWRMGEDNSEKIQGFLRELRYAMDEQTQ